MSKVPEGWKINNIGSLLERIVDPIKPNAEKMYQEIGIKSHTKGIFHKKQASGKSLGNKRVFKIHPNCLIMNIVFAWEQAIAKTSDKEVGMIASHRFPMYKPRNNLVNIDYVLYLFKSPKGKHLLKLASPGGAGRNKTLGQKEFEKLEILVPSIKEQAKIVQILSTWDKAIETVEKLIANAQQQKKALMQQLLTGKKRFPGFEGKWAIVSFNDILKIEIGGTPSRNNPDYWDEEKLTKNRWLSIADLKGRVINDTREYISDLGVSKSNVKLIPANTVVMSFKLTIGKCAILANPTYTNEAICALIPKDNQIDTKYLFQALGNVKFDEEIDKAIKGLTLNKEKIKRLKLKLPDLLEQKKLADVFFNSTQEIENFQNQLAFLQQEKKSLMQLLLTGKQRVK